MAGPGTDDGKIDVRPWTKGLVLNFSNHYLKEGDEIYLDFKSWRMQTFGEKTFEFKVLVDPFATAKYLELPSSPVIKIIPDRAARLKVVAPTKVKAGAFFNFLVKIEDQWGNPCFNQDGVFLLGHGRGPFMVFAYLESHNFYIIITVSQNKPKLS